MPTGPGDILDLIRHGRASTRGDVLEATGLSRMTVAQRLDALSGAAMIVEGDTTEATGGRRRRSLTFNTSQSRVLAAAVDTTHTHIAVTDLGGTVLARGPDRRGRGGRSARGAGSDRDGRGGAAGPAGRHGRGPVRGRAQPARPGRPRVRTSQSTADPAGVGRLPGRRAPARGSPRCARADRERRRRGRPRRVRGGLLWRPLPVPGQGLHGHRHRNRHRRALLHRCGRRRRRHRPRAGLAEVRGTRASAACRVAWRPLPAGARWPRELTDLGFPATLRSGGARAAARRATPTPRGSRSRPGDASAR